MHLFLILFPSIFFYISGLTTAAGYTETQRVHMCAFRGREVKSLQSSHENFPDDCLYSGSCGFDLHLLTSPHQQSAYLPVRALHAPHVSGGPEANPTGSMVRPREVKEKSNGLFLSTRFNC
ncbi:hypothetical protein ILYODFUR_025207 [Ilyodon furcidens]|uniref:Secreted protein n=1 Tax=Ilyodon furcidens TaxID=33524 RepID=A0ABV0VII8_9TELE